MKYNADVLLQSERLGDRVTMCPEPMSCGANPSLCSNPAEVMTAAEGRMALAQHAASLARFGLGTGAFLAPLYGGSEMSQAFCRVAAVHGALYVLRQPVNALLMDPKAADEPDAPRKCCGVRLSTGQVIPTSSSLHAQNCCFKRCPCSISPWMPCSWTLKPLTSQTLQGNAAACG